jgi:hypothetical protein
MIYCHDPDDYNEQNGVMETTWSEVMDCFKHVRSASFDEFMTIIHPNVNPPSIEYHHEKHHTEFAVFTQNTFLWYMRQSMATKIEFTLYLDYIRTSLQENHAERGWIE